MDEDEAPNLPSLEANLRNQLHKGIRCSSSKLVLVRLFRDNKLTQTEQEILLVLVLSALGMGPSVSDMEDVQGAIRRKGRESLAVAKALHPDARLATAGLVTVEEEDEFADTRLSVPADIVSALLGRKGNEDVWKVKTQDELLDRLHPLVQSLRRRSEALEQSNPFLGDPKQEISKTTRAVTRQSDLLRRTLDRHPNWPLKQIDSPDLDPEEPFILLALLGKELGFVDAEDDFFTGLGLARAVSTSVPDIRHNLELLRRDRRLRKDNFIRVCGGFGDAAAVEDEATLRTCEFELTDEFLANLKVKRQRKQSNKARQAVVKPSQLILSHEVREALNMAVAQAKHNRVLIEQWGLGEAIPYGRAVTLLFTGPPGVGKTASAEAMAYELGKPIIVIDYAEIQNCFVGETEKNIVRAFREAREADAVLFWDKADAMFYDRDSAYRNWEVRDVNVLLTELERFDGLCILATNRVLTLDKALERRISLKVEFEPPDRPMREQIWRRLVPAKLPLADDVDFDALSEGELTGGEIKNTVLNAARIALARDPDGKVTMSDFRKAIEMETQGRWHEGSEGAIGFRR